MVSANEIRVGNRFIRELHNSRGLEYDHDFVMTEFMLGKLFTPDTGLSLQDLFPIPLSQDILEKAGFEWDEIDMGNKKEKGLYKDVVMMLPSSNGKTWYAAPYGYPLAPQRTYYLHQLQNLYYSLTNQELTINL